MIAAPDGRVFISPIACSALATAGSGDVLCGVIGALLAGGSDPLVAAQTAVYVHGLAGEALASELGDGVTAGDLPPAVAAVIARLVTRPGATSPARAAAPSRPARAGGQRPRRPSSPRRRRRARR